jgi:hypothetical protein
MSPVPCGMSPVDTRLVLKFEWGQRQAVLRFELKSGWEQTGKLELGLPQLVNLNLPELVHIIGKLQLASTGTYFRTRKRNWATPSSSPLTPRHSNVQHANQISFSSFSSSSSTTNCNARDRATVNLSQFERYGANLKEPYENTWSR